MEKMERILRRMAVPDGSEASGEIVIPTQHGQVRSSFSAKIAQFLLYVPLPSTPSTDQAYRGNAQPVIRAPRPLSIVLRSQTKADEQYIASGIAREVSVGDKEFDEEVYIHTECDDESVKLVLNEEARRAILDLFTIDHAAVTLDHVTIDDSNGRVVAQWTMRSRAAGELDAAQLARAIAAIDALAGALPTIISTGLKREPRALERAVNAANIASVIGLPLTIFAVSRAPTGIDFVPAIIGGTIASAVLISLCCVFIRGSSGSPAIRGKMIVACIWLSLEIAIVIDLLVH